MTTIVNNPGGQQGSGMSVVLGSIIAIVVLAAVAALFMYYGLPALRGSDAPKDNSLDINVTLPTNTVPTDSNTSAQ